MQELISGILGPETAASFLGYLSNREYTIPSAAAVLSDYESVRPQMVKLVQNGRLDIVNLVMNRVVSLIDGTSIQYENLDKMLADMTNEFQLLFFKILANEKPESFLEITQQVKMFDNVSDQLMQSLT
jgi:hypothetical protein